MVELKHAIKIIQQEKPNMKILECVEFPNFFAFSMNFKEYEKNEFYAGAFDTVNKSDGSIGRYNPVENLSLLKSAKKIDIDIVKN